MRTTVLAAGLVAAIAGVASAADFTPGNLVVMRVSNGNGPTGSGNILLDEFTTGGAALPNTLAIDTGISLPNALNHDRHLHRSTDGRFLTFAAYAAPAGNTDPSTASAASVNRVVGIVGHDGSVDTSTRLNNSFEGTGIRSAFTTNGQDIWVSGDNLGGATTSGGLRYTSRGWSTSNNLSRTQTTGGTPTPDNVRDALIFDGQLYDSSGSSASIGKGVLRVGTGTPTAGAQSVVGLTTSLNVSASSFFMLDLNPAIPGVDTMYAATDNLRKYILSTSGTWAAAGTVANASNNAFENVIARANPDGSVSVFAAGPAAVISITDPAGVSGSITGLAASTIISAPSGYTLGGIEFTPVPAPAGAAALVGAALLAARRRR